MAAITRTTADARPTNDILTVEITMDVACEAGELIYVKSNGKGAVADRTAAATMPALGVATMDTPAGRAVAVVTQGKFGGWSSMTPGAPAYAGATGELDNAASVTSTQVNQVIGIAVSATDVYVNPQVVGTVVP